MNKEPVPSKRVAIIDVGSNAVKLLVAGEGNPLRVLHSGERETRLSRGIGKGQKLCLSSERMEASVGAICDLVEEARCWTPRIIQVYATSAVREATNKHTFCSQVRVATGMDLQVLSGEEEALCVARSAEVDPSLKGIDAFSVFDLGGGSLECIQYAQGELKQVVSLPLGSVRMIEQFVSDPTAQLPLDAIEKISANIEDVIEASSFPLLSVPLIGMGGSFTVARLLLATQAGQGVEDSSPELSLIQLRKLFRKVIGLSKDQRCRSLNLSSGRADIFPVALLTIIKLAEIAKQDRILHSFFNLRCGLALKLLAELIQEEGEVFG